MYNSSHLFSSFIKGGRQVHHDKNIQYYTYELDESLAECKDLTSLRKSFSEINSSCELSFEDGKFRLEFGVDSSYWEPGFSNYFYATLDHFIKMCLRSQSVPSKFYILDRGVSEESNDHLLSKVVLIVKWVDLLSKMADHVHVDNNVFVFFVHYKEGKTKTYEISPLLDASDIESLDLDCDNAIYERLYNSWDLKDAQAKDRQSVMLASFAEIISSIDNEDEAFKFFLLNTRKFHDRYCENYEIYVNRFTVDSQLREIDEQHLSFVGKLQDLVTSSQTKAFALPGVMVAIGALAKIDNVLGVVVVVIGAIMTNILIRKSNDFLLENLEHFKDTVDRALGHYVKSRVEAKEVISHAESAQGKLDTQLDKAKCRIKFINSMSNWMLAVSVIMALVILKVSVIFFGFIVAVFFFFRFKWPIVKIYIDDNKSIANALDWIKRLL